jgi:hypothetical protein
MNPLIQAVPEPHDRDAKPQSIKYLLAIIVIVGLFVAAAVVTGFIPAADARLVGNRVAADATSAPVVAMHNGEGRSCAG